MPIEFLVFGLTLLSIAIFHKRAMEAAFGGLAALLVIEYIKGDFSLVNHLYGHSYTH
jgi:hypothetical protein